ncbi:MAG: OmpH family outer membrane protein, partial [Salinisphaera sp.]|nr:OmpH family outer membrane protein [Salinisphaera sp.]
VVTQRINGQIDPLLDAIYAEQGCSILRERGVVLRGNQGNDLTAAVISALNNQASTISFGLLVLPGEPSSRVE